MRLNARELLVFSAMFILVFLVLALIWPVFAPIYNAITVALANVLFPLVEEPDITMLKPEGNSVAIYVVDPSKGPLLFAYLDYPHSGLIILLALLLATPRLTWKRCLMIILLGMGLLIVVHSISLIAKTRFEYVNIFGNELPVPDSVYLRYAWLGRALVIISLVAPFVLWALLTFRYWFPKPVASTPAPPPRKRKHAKGVRP